MITIIHYQGGYKAAYNSRGKQVLGTGYFTGRQPPNFPVPAIQSEVYHTVAPNGERQVYVTRWDNDNGQVPVVRLFPYLLY